MLFYEKNVCHITIVYGICLKVQKYIHDIDKTNNIDDDDDVNTTTTTTNNNNNNSITNNRNAKRTSQDAIAPAESL